MTTLPEIALLVSFSALAGAGAFYIQELRLKMEGAKVIVADADLRNGGEISLTICNVGGRAASDIELSLGRLQVDGFLEGLKAGDERNLVLPGKSLPATLTISYSDDRGGRIAHERVLVDLDGRLSVGLRVQVEALGPANTHLLLSEKDQVRTEGARGVRRRYRSPALTILRKRG